MTAISIPSISFHTHDSIPALGFGTWDVRGRTGLATLLTAMECGYRLFDTAKMYFNEEIVGQAIHQSGLPRSELFITSKMHSPYGSYDKARLGIEQSLESMGLDYLDLMLIHEPCRGAAQMYKALYDARAQGLIRNIGVSNFSRSYMEDFLQECPQAQESFPVLNQVESHVYFPQLELQHYLQQHGCVMQAWAPFTEGRRRIFSDPVLVNIARKHGKTSGQVALRYLLQNHIAVVVKSARKERMLENLQVFDFELDESDLADIRRLDEGSSIFGWY